jgi:hypothetical protein
MVARVSDLWYTIGSLRYHVDCTKTLLIFLIYSSRIELDSTIIFIWVFCSSGKVKRLKIEPLRK